MSRRHKVNFWEQRNKQQQIEYVAHCLTCDQVMKSLDKAKIEFWRDIHLDPELRRRLRSMVREI